MKKWADYGISAVDYVSSKITYLCVHEDLGNKFGKRVRRSRTWVINEIKKEKKTFITIVDDEDKWSKGADVHVVPVKGNEYLRTDWNKTEEDNLGKLPKCTNA